MARTSSSRPRQTADLGRPRAPFESQLPGTASHSQSRPFPVARPSRKSCRQRPVPKYCRRSSATERVDDLSEAVVHRLVMPAGIKGRLLCRLIKRSDVRCRPIPARRDAPKLPKGQAPAFRVSQPRSSRSRPPGPGQERSHEGKLVSGRLKQASRQPLPDWSNDRCAKVAPFLSLAMRDFGVSP